MSRGGWICDTILGLLISTVSFSGILNTCEGYYFIFIFSAARAAISAEVILFRLQKISQAANICSKNYTGLQYRGTGVIAGGASHLSNLYCPPISWLSFVDGIVNISTNLPWSSISSSSPAPLDKESTSVSSSLIVIPLSTPYERDLFLLAEYVQVWRLPSHYTYDIDYIPQTWAIALVSISWFSRKVSRSPKSASCSSRGLTKDINNIIIISYYVYNCWY